MCMRALSHTHLRERIDNKNSKLRHFTGPSSSMNIILFKSKNQRSLPRNCFKQMLETENWVSVSIAEKTKGFMLDRTASICRFESARQSNSRIRIYIFPSLLFLHFCRLIWMTLLFYPPTVRARRRRRIPKIQNRSGFGELEEKRPLN